MKATYSLSGVVQDPKCFFISWKSPLTVSMQTSKELCPQLRVFAQKLLCVSCKRGIFNTVIDIRHTSHTA